MLSCKICENSEDNRIHTVKEMNYGTRDAFDYLECKGCGCLQILAIPDNISKYYPSDYYSFSAPHQFRSQKEKFISSQIARYELNGIYPIGRWYFKKYPAETYPHIYRIPAWLRGNRLRLNRKSRILDVGCGAGSLLYEMKELFNFDTLVGIDPFIESDRHYENGVKVIKTSLDDLNNQFDVIMLHHSFEHMPDPLNVFMKLRELISPKGHILIRIPTCSSYAWRNYGVNWAQLDAPRHFFIHSVQSLRILAEQSGFKINKVIYDSNEFQFWASEQYKIGMPLRDDNSYGMNPEKSIFTDSQIDGFAKMAKELNESEDGDQACFFLEAK